MAHPTHGDRSLGRDTPGLDPFTVEAGSSPCSADWALFGGSHEEYRAPRCVCVGLSVLGMR